MRNVLTTDELAEPAAAPEDLAVFDAEVLVELEGMGISEIDPQPITQIAGEGIDLDTAPGVELLADEPQG